MIRKAEKRLLMIAAIWNIICAGLTIFGYSSWFRQEGLAAFELQKEYSYLSTSVLDSLVKVVMIYGLLILAIGIINLYVSRFLENQLIDRRVMIWLGVCTVISFLSFDVVGIFLYLVTFVVYAARNKALKIS